jgi:hypothetical protein
VRVPIAKKPGRLVLRNNDWHPDVLTGRAGRVNAGKGRSCGSPGAAPLTYFCISAA